MLITSNENIETVPFVIHFYDVYTTESFDLYDITIIQRNYILSFRRKFLNNISPAEKVRFIISQNIDALHLRSAVQGQYLAELHGNMLYAQKLHSTITNLQNIIFYFLFVKMQSKRNHNKLGDYNLYKILRIFHTYIPDTSHLIRVMKKVKQN